MMRAFTSLVILTETGLASFLKSENSVKAAICNELHQLVDCGGRAFEDIGNLDLILVLHPFVLIECQQDMGTCPNLA